MSDAIRNLCILGTIALLIALPFLFRRDQPADVWQPGDPVLIVISPHNEAIRTEFATAFSAWHARHFGSPVRIDWRSIGGTTEIMRYLESEFTAAFRAWARQQDMIWPGQAAMAAFDARFQPAAPQDPAAPNELHQQQVTLWQAFRTKDDPAAFGASIDLFFGGGTYDHGIAARKGFSVPPWPAGQRPEHLFNTPDGITLIPEWVAGENWSSDHFIGTCISTFGICSNRDRLQDLGITEPPRTWRALADPRLFRQVGVADPTKSGSIAKAFEMMIQQECRSAVETAGFTTADIERYEQSITAARLPPGILPPEVPETYQAAIEQGWRNGLNLIRLIGANARYFTDAAGKVPVDVSNGDAAAGIVIDFYGRYQAEFSRAPDGAPRLEYYTPIGGSSVSADPISLLRGAPNREIAVRFVEFVISPEGQQLWTYRPGTIGGPQRFALRRLPIRRDFYPAPEHPELHNRHREHLRFSTDDLADPSIDPYQLARTFTYYPRWTASHFGVHRNLIRAMAMDAGHELQNAWQQLRHQDPAHPRDALPPAMTALPDEPEPLTWRSALELHRNHNRLELIRIWTRFFRNAYRQASADTRREAP